MQGTDTIQRETQGGGGERWREKRKDGNLTVGGAVGGSEEGRVMEIGGGSLLLPSLPSDLSFSAFPPPEGPKLSLACIKRMDG